MSESNLVNNVHLTEDGFVVVKLHSKKKYITEYTLKGEEFFKECTKYSLSDYSTEVFCSFKGRTTKNKIKENVIDRLFYPEKFL